ALAAHEVHATAHRLLVVGFGHGDRLVDDVVVARASNRLLQQGRDVDQHSRTFRERSSHRNTALRGEWTTRGGVGDLYSAPPMNAVGYLRELPDVEPELSLEAQHRAYLDACTRLGLAVGTTFTDAAPNAAEGDDPAPDPELRRMLRRLMLDGQHRFTTVVAASPRVLGDTARGRIRRILQLAALGLPLQFADGTDPDRAVLDEWARRAPGERRRERAIEGMRRRALRGEVLGRSPYGYRIT